MAEEAPAPWDVVDIDGEVLDEPSDGMIRVVVEIPENAGSLPIGQRIAFLPDSQIDSDDRYLGTVLMANSDTELVLMMDREDLTTQVGQLADEKSPFTPIRGTGPADVDQFYG